MHVHQHLKIRRMVNVLKMIKTLNPLQSSPYILCKSCLKIISREYNSKHSFFSLTNITNKHRRYYKKELIGYSVDEMYSVVSDVKNYYKFVPYVKKSHVHSEHASGFQADLIVGFPPLNEIYTSNVRLKSPSLVTSECKDGRLFHYLLNEWRFNPGLKDIPQSCVLDFKVSFEFKSLLHSNIANLFFDLICDQMENAFIIEAKRRFGVASIKSHILTSSRS